MSRTTRDCQTAAGPNHRQQINPEAFAKAPSFHQGLPGYREGDSYDVASCNACQTSFSVPIGPPFEGIEFGVSTVTIQNVESNITVQPAY